MGGKMVEGTWVPDGAKYEPDTGDDGSFQRKATTFRDWVRNEEGARFQPEAGRYHLYVSYACPWAHRTLLVRALRRLEDVISVTVVDPFMGEDGWTFSNEGDCTPDPIFGVDALKDVYLKADENFTGRITVPVLWDRKEGTIVNNESREIIRMFNTSFAHLGNPEVSFYGDAFDDATNERIEETIDAIYEPVNNGVYRCGFAQSQEAYSKAFQELFEALDHWDEVLGTQRYICGDRITEADWCMFTTLLRFDPVYVVHFKCNKRMIRNYPNLSGYLRELYQIPGVAQTCSMDHIKEHYYTSHRSLNPNGIIPDGPTLDLDAPHGRD